MNKKATGILAYITIIGWIVAYLLGDKEEARFHLNQGLVINIISLILGFISRIDFFLVSLASGVLSLVVFVFAIMGIVYAATDRDQELPFIGGIQLLK
jgi:uncharacterized membrane protein